MAGELAVLQMSPSKAYTHITPVYTYIHTIHMYMISVIIIIIIITIIRNTSLLHIVFYTTSSNIYHEHASIH